MPYGTLASVRPLPRRSGLLGTARRRREAVSDSSPPRPVQTFIWKVDRWTHRPPRLGTRTCMGRWVTSRVVAAATGGRDIRGQGRRLDAVDGARQNTAVTHSPVPAPSPPPTPRRPRPSPGRPWPSPRGVGHALLLANLHGLHHLHGIGNLSRYSRGGPTCSPGAACGSRRARPTARCSVCPSARSRRP